MMWSFRALFLLLSFAHAVTLQGPQHNTNAMMRNEVQLGASAEMIHIRSRPAPVNFAGQDYITGVNGVDRCQRAEHRFITSDTMCKEAANEMNLDMLGVLSETEEGGFYTHSDHYLKFPRGCYKAKCGNDDSNPDKQCIFFNRVADLNNIENPTEENSTNICARDKFRTGTVDSNGTANATTCPVDYVVMMDRVPCEEAAQQLGSPKGSDGAGANFLIGVFNRTKHDMFPQGCFMNSDTNRTFLNPRRPMLDPANSSNLNMDWIPGNPIGTPICTAGAGVTPDATATR